MKIKNKKVVRKPVLAKMLITLGLLGSTVFGTVQAVNNAYDAMNVKNDFAKTNRNYIEYVESEQERAKKCLDMGLYTAKDYWKVLNDVQSEKTLNNAFDMYASKSQMKDYKLSATASSVSGISGVVSALACGVVAANMVDDISKNGFYEKDDEMEM